MKKLYISIGRGLHFPYLEKINLRISCIKYVFLILIFSAFQNVLNAQVCDVGTTDLDKNPMDNKFKYSAGPFSMPEATIFKFQVPITNQNGNSINLSKSGSDDPYNLNIFECVIKLFPIFKYFKEIFLILNYLR